MDKGQVEIKENNVSAWVYFDDCSFLPKIVHGSLKEENSLAIIHSLVGNGGQAMAGKSGDAWREARINLDNKTILITDNGRVVLFLPLAEFKNVKNIMCF